MNNDPVDIITLLVTLFALVTNEKLAQVFSPYAAIVILACVGASVSLSGNKKPMSTLQGCWYVTLRVMLAVALTVAFAEVIEAAAPWAKPRVTLIPIALVIGLVPDYESVRSWFAERITRYIDRKIDNGN